MLDLSHSACSVSPSPVLSITPWVPHHKIQPLADNFEVYMQKQTTAGVLEPDSVAGGNIYMMLFCFFVRFFLVY